MNQDGIRYERSRHVRTIVDRMTRDEIMDHDRMRKAAETGYRIDRLFERICVRRGINPDAAMVAGPLLSLALATLDEKTNQAPSDGQCEASQI